MRPCVLWSEHPAALASANGLGCVLGQQCEHSEALLAFWDAVTAAQRALGAERLKTLAACSIHALAAQPVSEPSQQLAQQALQEMGELRAQLQGFNSKLAEAAAVAHGNARGAAESSL